MWNSIGLKLSVNLLKINPYLLKRKYT